MSFRRNLYNVFFRLSPILIVVLLELALRFLGVGNSYLMFQKSEDGLKMELNPNHYKQYLCDKQFPEMDLLIQDFDKEKTEDTYRVFLISDHSLIQALPETQTEALLPDFILKNGKKVDVIQIAVPFTNSFAVKRMVASARKNKADACIVFTGRNEFYGLPKKSAWMRDINNYWGLSAYVRMKNHRLIQVLDRFLYLKKPFQSSFPPDNLDFWAIETDSVEYKESLQYFAKNLSRMDKKINVPIFFVNLPVNIKEKPYRSYFDDKELNDIEFVREFNEILRVADNYSIEKWLEDLYAWEPETAIYYYCKALLEEKNNNLDLAIEYFNKAIKLDAFKVRMDEDFKDLLYLAAEKAPNRLVDLEAELTATSSILDNDRYFNNGLELNAYAKSVLIKMIKEELTVYFSKEINKE